MCVLSSLSISELRELWIISEDRTRDCVGRAKEETFEPHALIWFICLIRRWPWQVDRHCPPPKLFRPLVIDKKKESFPNVSLYPFSIDRTRTYHNYIKILLNFSRKSQLTCHTFHVYIYVYIWSSGLILRYFETWQLNAAKPICLIAITTVRNDVSLHQYIDNSIYIYILRHWERILCTAISSVEHATHSIRSTEIIQPLSSRIYIYI